MLKRRKAEDAIGALNKQALWVIFDSRLRLEFHGSKITSDAGLWAYRELDETLGLTDLAEGLLNDWRTGKYTQHSMVTIPRELFRAILEGIGRLRLLIPLPGCCSLGGNRW